jgi:hypothetical protein
MRAVRLQFKHLCRRIDRQYKQNMQKLDKNTDSKTNGLCTVGILQRVAKQLQECATFTDGITDSICPVGILPRVAKKLQPLP